MIEAPEDAQLARVDVDADTAPASLEFVNVSESLQVQGEALQVEGAAVARADSMQPPLMAAMEAPAP